MSVVAVTGASGFIGSALARHFAERGSRVIALARKTPQQTRTGTEWRRFDLGDRAIPHDLLAGAELLIHAAMQPRSASDDAIQTNIEGTRALLDSARACGVRRRIFISSFSAHGEALSAYGQQKHAVESLFSAPGDAVVRPGLVIGNGGLFGRLVEDLRTRRIVPLIDGGMQPLQTIHIEDLCEAMERIITRGADGTFNLAEPQAISYKTFYAELSARLGVAPFFVPIPFALARCVLAVAATLRVPMPIGPENLLGLKAMRSRDTNTDIERLGIYVRDIRESLNASLPLFSPR
jgi:nucleoside-diphosphate-sugar epimerase